MYYTQNSAEINNNYFNSEDYKTWRKLAGLDENNVKRNYYIFNFDDKNDKIGVNHEKN